MIVRLLTFTAGEAASDECDDEVETIPNCRSTKSAISRAVRYAYLILESLHQTFVSTDAVIQSSHL
jgi:hypothetical protein